MLKSTGDRVEGTGDRVAYCLDHRVAGVVDAGLDAGGKRDAHRGLHVLVLVVPADDRLKCVRQDSLCDVM